MANVGERRRGASRPARPAPPSGQGARDSERSSNVLWFADLGRADVARVGGKGANLGELTRAGLPVPPGFVIGVDAFRAFLRDVGLAGGIEERLAGISGDDAAELRALSEELLTTLRHSQMPSVVEADIRSAYEEMRRLAGGDEPLVAVRSSATAEDTAASSFAGMFQSFLNVRGADALLRSVKECWASVVAPRVLFYRIKQGLAATEQLLAVVVQGMVDARKSGVMFTVDPASGNRDVLVIESAWGLGEVVVAGQVRPDRFVVSKRNLAVIDRSISRKEFELVRDPKTGANERRQIADERATAPSLTDDEVRRLAELGRRTEAHYGTPQDIEFAVDDRGVYLVQARPVTTLGQARGPGAGPLVRGLGASPGVATGASRVLHSPDEGDRLRAGEVLVAPMTTPDWVPLMRRAVAIVTDSGGMTSHAAIVSREMGLPCVVGTRQATVLLPDGETVTVDGREGAVYPGRRETTAPRPAVSPVVAPALVTATRLYVNLGEPARAEEVASLDVDGVGLLRAEFMILEALEGKHPRLLLERGQGRLFVERLAEGMRTFARAFHPRPVVYRSMDFRSNEFRDLEGGERFEPSEANPMIGYRGCYRAIQEPELFNLELEALKVVRRNFDNLHLMIPFVRTAWELARCKRLVDASGLGDSRSFQFWVMAEVPSVIHWIPAYAREGVTGVSIGSNDLTQLMLGVDRDSEILASLFDERDPAVLWAIHSIIETSRRSGLTSSICGQAPSVYPDYAETLVRWGIDSISVNPDAIPVARRHIAAAEQRILLAELRERAGRPRPGEESVERPAADQPPH